MAYTDTYIDTFTIGGKVHVTRTYNLAEKRNYPEIHGVLCADSRARDFDDFLPFNTALYNTHHIVCRGARVPQLQYELIRELKTIPRNDPTVVYVCGGVNELTFKEFHAGRVELCVHKQQKTLENLLDLKSKVRKWFPNALVCYSTIPIVNLKLAQLYYRDCGALITPKYDAEGNQSDARDP